MTQSMRLRSVGTIRNQQKQLIWGPGSAEDRTWDQKVAESKSAEAAVSQIEIAPDLNGILDGIEEFSHLMVLYWPNRIPDEQHTSAVKGHPMGREDWPLVGIFATRSPVRPNLICSTVVKLIERNGNILQVTGLDALDGSPVIDIKPHIPADCPIGDVRMPEWMHRIHREFNAAKGESISGTDSRSEHVQQA